MRLVGRIALHTILVGWSITPPQANYNRGADAIDGAVRVVSFEPNPWALFNVHGNGVDRGLLSGVPERPRLSRTSWLPLGAED